MNEKWLEWAVELQSLAQAGISRKISRQQGTVIFLKTIFRIWPPKRIRQNRSGCVFMLTGMKTG